MELKDEPISPTSVTRKLIIARPFDFTPEELEIIAKELRLAAQERANPKEEIFLQVRPGVIFRYNPNLTRSDLEKKLSLKLSPREPVIIPPSASERSLV